MKCDHDIDMFEDCNLCIEKNTITDTIKCLRCKNVMNDKKIRLPIDGFILGNCIVLNECEMCKNGKNKQLEIVI